MRRAYVVAISLTVMAVSTACESLAVAVFGVGASAGVNQAIDGTVSRTFTAPAHAVRLATLEAFKHMGVTVTSAADAGIRARANGREIDVDFEALSPSSTRMRVVAKTNTWLYDAATGREIVAQTEKALAETVARNTAPAPPAQANAGLEAPADAELVPVVNPIRLASPPTPLSPSK